MMLSTPSFRSVSSLILVVVVIVRHDNLVHAVDYELKAEELGGGGGGKGGESPLSLNDLQNLLFTEMNDEFESVVNTMFNDDDSDGNGVDNTRADGNDEDDDSQEDTTTRNRKLLLYREKLREDASLPEAELIWDHILYHGWRTSHKLSQSRASGSRRVLYGNSTHTANSSGGDQHGSKNKNNKNNERPMHFPFLVCSRTPLLHSGSQRLHPLLQFTGAREEDTIVISNDDHQTCYFISTTYEQAKFVDTAITNDEYVVLPFTDLMKIATSTIDLVQSESWSIPTPRQRIRAALRDVGGDIQEWERKLRVTFVEGRQELSMQSLMNKAEQLMDSVKLMGQQGAVARRRRLSAKNATDVNQIDVDDDDDDDHALTVTDTFSLTSATSVQNQNSRRARALSSSRIEFFSRSLSEGIEATHNCNIMFEGVEIRANVEDNSFDIVLNPSAMEQTSNSTATVHKYHKGDSESSASNPNCVVSLIMGLSVDPQVLNVEAVLPISPDDYESQWITQSNSHGHRPFFDSGLTGLNQIVSVTDSGLDINHRYFGPTSSAVYDRWSMSERKVVRYDHDRSGDRTEPFQGHGTRVAGIIAGRLSGKADDAADGIARDAKIHMWDMQKINGGFGCPDPNILFPAIYNNGRGAKITNGSWSAGYRPYSSLCRIYDTALHDDKFDDILFIASAGNTADDVPGRILNTIGEPASCKNVMAVGASQSHGDRLSKGDLGKDYLADFSSRGPTADGRMKPDIVAPGYTVLAPRAHAASQNKEETYETLGTSFSAPVVAGTAALIRQYFEEGWFPCGSKGCNRSSLQPSGALVKAVLMNGATDLRNVQDVPSGKIMEPINPYDNHQGMGLINLSTSLPLQNANSINAVAVNSRSIRDGETDIFVLKTKQCSGSRNSITGLSVTLSWYDPAGASNCVRCLINDLDLKVEEIKSGGRQFHPNGKHQPDRINNVERIRVYHPGSDTEYKVTVKAHNLASSTQKYSLIATGCFSIKDAGGGFLLH